MLYSSKEPRKETIVRFTIFPNFYVATSKEFLLSEFNYQAFFWIGDLVIVSVFRILGPFRSFSKIRGDIRK